MKDKQRQQSLLQQHGSRHIIDTLTPFVSKLRQQRIDEVLDYRLNGIQLAIEAPYDINNALAAVRSSEAMGISNIHIIAPQGEAYGAKLVTQGAMYWVDILFYDCLDDFLQYCNKHSIELAGGSLNTNTSLREVPVDNPICLMIGNEKTGLTPAAQKACDYLYRITMHGMSQSLNLSVSAAISLYDTTNRRRTLLQSNGDLTPTETETLRAQYYLNSVNPRLVRGLLESDK